MSDERRTRSLDPMATVDGPGVGGEVGATVAGRGGREVRATVAGRGGGGLDTTVDGPGVGGEVGATVARRDDGGELGATIGPSPGAPVVLSARAIEMSATLAPAGTVRPPAQELAVTRDSVGRSRPAAEGAALMPERLGRYLVIAQLGAGGMGVVYKAFDPVLDRKVALKLLRGEATAQGRARLLREAQAMARLSHPNVVPVFDVGVVDEQVFVAMDFVDGLTLSAWMQARHPWQEVVELFVQAGRGLAVAHAVGLVHRDFKPDNVLLSRDPATGELRAQVADFGLACGDDAEVRASALRDSVAALEADSALLDVGATRVGAVVGTPAYMSPEQHDGAPVDPRTDQFSFCVALFEALYGERPFTGDTLEELAEAASQPRRAAPPGGSAVPGWLHRLCVRGLQPAREARFPDMDALLAEIGRRRAQGRNRWLAAGGGAALVGAVAAVLLTRGEAVDPMAQRCAGGPARLAQVWGPKLAGEAERAFAATGLVYASDAWKAARGHVDRYGDAWLAMYRDSCEATVRGEQSDELMDLRTACLGRALQDLEALVGVYRASDREVVRRAVDMALALPSLDACADQTALRAVGDAPPAEQAAEVEAARTELAGARTLVNAGKYKDAAARASGVLEVATRVGYMPLTAEAKLTLGTARAAAGEPEAGATTLTEAIGAALASRDDARLLSGLVRLVGVVGNDLRRDKEAEAWGELARGVLLRTGSRPGDEAWLLRMQANSHIRSTRFPEAEAALLRSLALLEAEYGADHPRLMPGINALGAVYVRTGKYAEAEVMFTRAVALARASLGPNHPEVGDPLANLGFSFERQARYDEALTTLGAARDIFIAVHGPDHPRVGMQRQNMAYVLRLLGRLPEARAEADEALRILGAKLGEEHPALATAHGIRGDVALAEGDLARARAEHQKNDDIRVKALGADHSDRGFALLGLGKVALAEGDAAAAIGPLELALKLWSAGTPDPSDIGELRWQLARARWATGERTRARELASAARVDLVRAGVNSRALLAELDRWAAANPGP